MDWFAQPLAGDDTWWTVARVDVRTGKLATENTPRRFVVERRYLRVPDGVSEFARDDAVAWQYISGVPRGDAPTEGTDENDLPFRIASPGDGDPVRGLINIRGTANSPNFESYQLEYQSSINPGSWTVLGSGDTPILNGILADWDTSVLVPGLYIVRLQVNDAEDGDLYNQISMLVISTESQDDEPTPVITVVAQPQGGGTNDRN